MVVLKIVEGAKKHFVYRLSEWGLSLCLGSFALMLLGPWDTFGSSSGFRTMAQWGTELNWGLGIGFIVLLRLTALTFNGTFDGFGRYSPTVRCACSLACVPIWLALAVGFLESNPRGVGWGEHLVWLVVEAFLAVHIGKDAGIAWKGGHKGGTVRQTSSG